MEENKTYEYEEFDSLSENQQNLDLPTMYPLPTVPETNEKSNLPVAGLAIAGTAAVIGIGVLAKRKFCAWRKDWQEFKEWRAANVVEEIESETITEEANPAVEENLKNDQVMKESKKR